MKGRKSSLREYLVKMLKYTEAVIGLAEIPGEITLCINISNCPCHCKGCHSAYLAEDIGKELEWYGCIGKSKKSEGLSNLIKKNKGITCVCFMGGDNDPKMINELASKIKWHCNNIPEYWGNLKVAWYSGRQELAKEIDLSNFDFIKLGPYLEEYGPLNCRTTNQRFYQVVHTSMGTSKMYDITYRFYDRDMETS